MKLKPTAIGIALGLLCAIYMVLLTYYPAFSEVVFGEKKGLGWIRLMEDLYPQYNSLTWYAPLVGAAMGFLDGFIGGLLFGLLYNNFSRFFEKSAKKKK